MEDFDAEKNHGIWGKKPWELPIPRKTWNAAVRPGWFCLTTLIFGLLWMGQRNHQLVFICFYGLSQLVIPVFMD
jgi:hypothetical protein